MPISYPGGTVAEHTAVRTDVGVFDVSHLGKLSITGPGAAAFVNRCFTADLDKIGPGQAQYTLCCTSAAGGRRRDRLPERARTTCWPCRTPPTPRPSRSVLRAAAPSGIAVTDRHRTSRCSRCRGRARGSSSRSTLD
jgi:aminomethyltransferase